MSDPTNEWSAIQPPADTPQPGFWDNLGQQVGAGGYAALNQLGMGLPDVIMKAVADPQYQKLQALMAAQPEATQAGNIAGLAASLAIPVGGELNLAGKAAGALGAEKAAMALKGGADIASGVAPVAGLAQNIGKGVLQAAPQSLIRMATGNITPGQALTGVGIGGALGGAAGLLGGAAPAAEGAAAEGAPTGALSGLKNQINKWLLGASGVRIADERGPMTFGVPSQFTRARLNRMRDIGALTANTIADNGLHGMNVAQKIDQWHNQNIGRVFNAMDNAWQDLNPTAQDMKGLLNTVEGAALNGDPNLVGVSRLIQNDKTKWDGLANELIGKANNGDPLPDYQKFLKDYMYRDMRGMPAVEKAVAQREAAAAGDVLGHVEQTAINHAISGGAIQPGEVENAQELYPVDRILSNSEFRNEMKTKYVSAGSPTFEKMMLGAGLGGGTVLESDQRPMSPQKVLEDLAIGSVAGNVALPMITDLANSGAARIAGGANKALRGAPAVAGSLAGAAPIAAKAAQELPAAMGALGAQAAAGGVQTNQNPVATSPYSNVPTFAELQGASDPYSKLLAQQIANAYGGYYAFRQKPDGGRYTLDDVVKKAYQETNGFRPESSVGLLAGPGQNPAAVSQDLQIAKAINNLDWNALATWYGNPGQGGAAPLRGLASKLNIGKSRQAEQDLRQLLNAIPGAERPLVETQIDAIMKLPGLTTEQRKQQVEESIMSTGAFSNPSLMQTLGFVT